VAAGRVQLVRLSINTEFSINARFNTHFNAKDKLTLKFRIIPSLKLILSQ